MRTNSDISILLSIDPSSFPLGTGPKLYEIWHEGYYPVVWSNKHFKMIYFNFGHNDIDYEHKTNKDLSHTFENDTQDKLIIGFVAVGGRGEEALRLLREIHFDHDCSRYQILRCILHSRAIFCRQKSGAYRFANRYCWNAPTHSNWANP